MPIQGVFNTNGVKSTQDLASLSFASMITRLMPNGTAPLFALTSHLKSETALQTEHGYFSKAALFPYVKLTAALDAVATQATVDSTACLPDSLIHQRD